MHDAYRCAVMAECPTVLGRRLLPFSLWHAYALDAFDSPFASDGPRTNGDVILAAWICSRGFADAQRYLRIDRKAMIEECEAWGKTVSLEQVMEAGGIMARYIAEHVKSPPRVATGVSELAIPWPLAYFWKLCAGRLDAATIEQVWDMPVPWAVAYAAAASIAAGDESFLTEEVAAKLEEARKAAKSEAGNG